MIASKKCGTCKGAQTLSQPQIDALLKDVAGWKQVTIEGAAAISRKFKFKDFAESLAFVNKVGAIAEEQNHHPDIAFGWGYAAITLYTHSVGGLHENDFIIAAKINQL